jgi:hypothetical protein
MSSDIRQDYLAYMVRLWRITGDPEPVWRASVENPHTGERHVFASVSALLAFLQSQTGQTPSQEPHRDG